MRGRFADNLLSFSVTLLSLQHLIIQNHKMWLKSFPNLELHLIWWLLNESLSPVISMVELMHLLLIEALIEDLLLNLNNDNFITGERCRYLDDCWNEPAEI